MEFTWDLLCGLGGSLMTRAPNTRLLKSEGSAKPAQSLHCPAQAPTAPHMPPMIYSVTGKWELGMPCTHPDMGPPAEAQGPQQPGPPMAEPRSALTGIQGFRGVPAAPVLQGVPVAVRVGHARLFGGSLGHPKAVGRAVWAPEDCWGHAVDVRVGIPGRGLLGRRPRRCWGGTGPVRVALGPLGAQWGCWGEPGVVGGHAGAPGVAQGLNGGLAGPVGRETRGWRGLAAAVGGHQGPGLYPGPSRRGRHGYAGAVRGRAGAPGCHFTAPSLHFPASAAEPARSEELV